MLSVPDQDPSFSLSEKLKLDATEIHTFEPIPPQILRKVIAIEIFICLQYFC